MNAQKNSTQKPAVQAPNAVAKRIDEIAGSAMELFKSAGGFESELAVAQAVSDLRAALTPELMQPITALMNTDLGFRTDRDPKTTPKDKDGNPMVPYSVEIVRECFIESKLRGFHSIGNEWNIIAGRFYACKNGFRRKVTQWSGVTDFKDFYEPPRVVGDKGALVKCRATWNKDGIAQSVEREIPVRVNFGMGSDAILGKAQRKLLAAVHDRLTGVVTPEGEANEEVEVQPGAAKPSPRFAEAKPAVASEPPATKTPQQELAEIVTSAGFTFDDLILWGVGIGTLNGAQCDAYTCFDDFPENLASRIVSAKSGLLRGLKASKPQTAAAE
jgi:hypothetical protein